MCQNRKKLFFAIETDFIDNFYLKKKSLYTQQKLKIENEKLPVV